MKSKALVLQKSTEIDWGAFEKSLHATFGVNAVTFGKDGCRRTAGAVDPANGICDLIKQHPQSVRQICDAVQSYLNHEAQIKKRAVTEECAAGMYKIVVPLVRENEIDGFISACGRPFTSTDRIYTHYIHETTGEDEAEIEKLLSSLDPIDPRTIKDIITYISSYS